MYRDPRVVEYVGSLYSKEFSGDVRDLHYCHCEDTCSSVEVGSKVHWPLTERVCTEFECDSTSWV